MDVITAFILAAVFVAAYLVALVCDALEDRAAAAYHAETQRQLDRPRIRIVWSRDGGR